MTPLGRGVLTLENLAVLNGPKRYLVARPNNDGFAIVRQLGKNWVKDGDWNLDETVAFAIAILEGDAAALADRDGRQRLAACLAGIFVTATLSINEQGREVADVAGPA